MTYPSDEDAKETEQAPDKATSDDGTNVASSGQATKEGNSSSNSNSGNGSNDAPQPEQNQQQQQEEPSSEKGSVGTASSPSASTRRNTPKEAEEQDTLGALISKKKKEAELAPKTRPQPRAAADAQKASSGGSSSSGAFSPNYTVVEDKARREVNAKLRAYESRRRATYTSKMESSSLYWRSFRDLLQASLQETARAERMVVGTAKANLIYAESMQASYDDVLLDDRGTLVSDKKRQQRLLEVRSQQAYAVAPILDKKKTASVSEERRSHVLNGLLESQLVLAEKFGDQANHLRSEIASEITELRQRLEEKVMRIQKLGDTIVGELERTETEVAEAWDTYFAVATKVLGGKNAERRGAKGADDDSGSGTRDVVENCADLWLAEMHYRVVVGYQSKAWQKGSAELSKLFSTMKETECQRRLDLREYLVAFVQRQERLFASLPEVQTGALTDLVGREMDRSKLQAAVQASIHKRAEELQKEDAKKRPKKKKPVPGLTNVDETLGQFQLESPLLSDMVMKANVIEMRGAGLVSQWKKVLAVVTADSFLHLFELPSSGPISAGSAPEIAFEALMPKIETPMQDSLSTGKALSLVKGWCDSLSPTESMILPNCRISSVHLMGTGFDITETTKNTGASAVFGKTTNRKMTLRMLTHQDAKDWVEILKAQKQ